VQVDSPLAVYDHPADMFVGGFIGTPPMNFLDAQVVQNGGPPVAEVSGGQVPLPEAQAFSLSGRELVLGIRAEAIGVEREPGDGLIRATLVVLEPLGSHNLLTVQMGDDLLKVSTPPDVFPAPGSDVWLRLEPEHIRWMDRETRAALSAPVPAAAPAA
jgi:multiple sugar transport system ATP-binding protein